MELSCTFLVSFLLKKTSAITPEKQGQPNNHCKYDFVETGWQIRHEEFFWFT